MYARNVSIELKPDSAAEFSRTLESDILPLLRMQPGFKDQLTFLTDDGKRAVAISLWDAKGNAEAYGRNSYAAVVRSLEPVMIGTPDVQTYEVTNSTFHKILGR